MLLSDRCRLRLWALVWWEPNNKEDSSAILGVYTAAKCAVMKQHQKYMQRVGLPYILGDDVYVELTGVDFALTNCDHNY